MKIKPAFIVVFFIFLILPSLALAQGKAFDIEQLRVFPSGEGISVSEFEKNTVLFEKIPFDRKELAYSLRLPATWQDRSAINSGEILGIGSTFLSTIGRYVGPAIGDVRPVTQVRAIRLKTEIEVVDWFKDYVMRNGYAVKVIDTQSNRQMRAVYTKFENGIAFATMAKLDVTGNIAIITEISVPTIAFSNFVDFQVRVLDSFAMKQPLVGTIEKQRRFALLDSVKFHYPSSWSVRRPDFASLDRLSVEVHRYDVNRILFGKIKILSLLKNEKADVKAEIAGVVDQLNNEGWTVKNLVEKRPRVANSLYASSEIEVYDVEVKDQENLDQELWFTVLQNDRHHFFLSMTTPSRVLAYNEWAQNKAVFNNIIETMSPSKKF